jgi:hypothetical protein
VERRFQGNGAWNLVRWAKEAKDLSSVSPHSFVTFAQLVTSCDQLPRSPVTTRSCASGIFKSRGSSGNCLKQFA